MSVFDRSLRGGIDIGNALGKPMLEGGLQWERQKFEEDQRKRQFADQLRLLSLGDNGIQQVSGSEEPGLGFVAQPKAIGETEQSNIDNGFQPMSRDNAPLAPGFAFSKELKDLQQNLAMKKALDEYGQKKALDEQYRKPTPMQVFGQDPNSKRPLIFNPETGTTSLGVLPDGVDYGAKPSATGGGPVDPEALKGTVEIYRKTGQIPPFGMGNNPMRTAFFAAIGGGDSSSVDEGLQNKAVRAGMSKAYSTQQNLFQAEKTSLSTLDKQLTLAEDLSSKVDRTGSPLINKYLLWTKGQIVGDADTAALDNVTTTAGYEFAKILSGASASIAGVTISSADDAKKLLSSSLGTGQFSKIIGLMRQEAQYRLTSRQQTIDGLKNDLGNIGNSQENQPAAPPSQQSAKGTSALKVGRFTVTPH